MITILTYIVTILSFISYINKAWQIIRPGIKKIKLPDLQKKKTEHNYFLNYELERWGK